MRGVLSDSAIFLNGVTSAAAFYPDPQCEITQATGLCPLHFEKPPAILSPRAAPGRKIGTPHEPPQTPDTGEPQKPRGKIRSVAQVKPGIPEAAWPGVARYPIV